MRWLVVFIHAQLYGCILVQTDMMTPANGNSPHKGQWHGALMFSLIHAWINGWVNNGDTGDLRRHRTYYDVIVMRETLIPRSSHCDGACGVAVRQTSADSRFAPSQWEMVLLYNDVSHWLGASLESALQIFWRLPAVWWCFQCHWLHVTKNYKKEWLCDTTKIT